MKEMFLVVFAAILMFAPVYGYVSNVVDFISADFKQPYKMEAIRAVGVVAPPIGCVLGYFKIKDGEE